jgi:GTP-sensing pleiotropic transcriptional regulator CodY
MTTEKTMTKREFLAAIVNGEELTPEIMDFAAKEIEKLDAANAKNKARAAKKREENVPLIDAITEYLKTVEDTAVASEIAEEIGVSTQKAAALLRGMKSDGVIDSKEVKNGKSKVNGYFLV